MKELVKRSDIVVNTSTTFEEFNDMLCEAGENMREIRETNKCEHNVFH